MTNSGIEEIAKALENCQELTNIKLHLKNNNIDTNINAYEIITTSLKKLPKLKKKEITIEKEAPTKLRIKL